MSKHRNRQAWLALFSRWESSGLRAVDFCRREGVSSQYFSQRQRQLGWSKGQSPVSLTNPANTGPAFAPVRVMRCAPEAVPPTAVLILRRGDCELHLPASLPEAQLRCILREVFSHAVV